MTLKLIENDNIKEISLEDFIKNVKSDFYYFHKDTSYKTLKDLIDRLSEEGYTVYFREVKYGLDEGSYMYEMHVL